MLEPRKDVDNAGKQSKKNDDSNKKKKLYRILFYFSLFWLLSMLLFSGGGESIKPGVSFSTLLSKIESSPGSVESVVVDDNKSLITIKYKNGKSESANFPILFSEELTKRLIDSEVKLEAKAPERPNFFSNLLLALLPVALILGFMLLLMRKGSLGLGKFNSKKTSPVEVPKTRFADVAGVDEAVEELREVVDILHNPDRFNTTGAKPSRGFLLVGPPGTGKTLLARAVAGEAGVPFFAISGSDFVEMFVGLGAARVRELFEKARGCGRAIVFIDEIDAVGKSRGGTGAFSGSNEERENTLNQLLVEMDGFEQSGIVMIAATNRVDVLDPALTRPGRFDRKIVVPAPDKKGREAIMRMYAEGKPFDSVDWAEYARRTPGMTGADISSMLNEAALEAARRGLSSIPYECVESALQTTALGRERRSAQITERDRRIVAWHEAGHATVALVLPDAMDPVSVTIIPRGAAGGVTWMSGSDHSFLTKSQAKAQLAVSMGGRAGEERLLSGDYTQGAHGDLSSATALASDMVNRYGMGSKLLVRGERVSVGNDPTEDEVAELISDSLVVAREVLSRHEELFNKIAQTLLEEESLSKKRLNELVELVDSNLFTERSRRSSDDDAEAKESSFSLE
ncbi:MAG: ATP-dependent metallopeptidase FtsH/Yme1/Tma family protein [Candidatus Paceibacterota bacterium]